MINKETVERSKALVEERKQYVMAWYAAEEGSEERMAATKAITDIDVQIKNLWAEEAPQKPETTYETAGSGWALFGFIATPVAGVAAWFYFEDFWVALFIMLGVLVGSYLNGRSSQKQYVEKELARRLEADKASEKVS